MNTFEITIQRKVGTIWPVVVEQNATEVFLPTRNEGALQLDLVELTSQSTPRDYGTMLGKALFRDERLRAAFGRALLKGDDCLHVLLLVEDAELRTLRWERLCAPLDGAFDGRWDFLGLNQRVPFSLYLPSVTDQRFPPIGRRDLRALILVASPQDPENRWRLAPFDVMATVTGIRAALGEIQADVLAAIEGAAGPPTLDGLCEQITAEGYTLLHIVCHGSYKPDIGESFLYLAKADKTVDPVPGQRLLERLGRLRGARGLPHFAFLSACESAVPEVSAALGGLAQRMVQSPELGMPAVLAMTEKVSVVTAQRLSEGFYRQLRKHGEPDRALVEACAGLADRHDVNVPALYSRLGGRPLFSMEDRPLTNAEIEYGLTRTKELFVKRAPVLLPQLDRDALTLRGTLQAELESLSQEARKERHTALDSVSNICDEALDLTFVALALGQEPPAYDERCPFRGLYPFRVEDREFFFGREALVTRLEALLAEVNFLAVLGPSGSGKSSVVLAGLVPALMCKEPNFEMAYLTPGSDPLDFLEAVLQGSQRASLLVVDQLEELFTLCTNGAKRRAFLDRLLQLRTQMRVVLTLRADFVEECLGYPDLNELMPAPRDWIAPMNTAELRRAMEMQAAKVGLRFEADLSNTILDDVQGEPGAMPLLQHALLELWKRRHGRWLRAEEYRAIGGVKKAIAETAEAVYRDLSSHDQECIRAIFVRLTRLDEEALNSEERRDTRQRVGLDELTPAGSEAAGTKTLVKRLADARLLVTGVNAVTGREEVEVGHEALIRYWPRLRGWLDEDRADLRVLASVRLAAQEWQKNQEDESLLTHHGARLIEAYRLLAHARLGLNQEEVKYLHACKDRQDRPAKRERDYQWRIVQVSVAGAIIAVGLAIWAWIERYQALKARTDTEIIWASELFRPLGHQSGGLNLAEVSALTALGQLPETQAQVRVRFVTEALANLENARRFANQFPAAVQASVGLNNLVAPQVAEILLKKLNESEMSPTTRTAAALAIAELNRADKEVRELAAEALVLALNNDNPIVPFETLVGTILRVTRGLPPERAATYLERAAKVMAGALPKESDFYNREALVGRLVEVCKRLPRERAATCLLPIANNLAWALANESDYNAGAALARGLVEVCKGGVAPELAANFLAGALTRETTYSAQEDLAGGLVEVCKGPSPERAATYLATTAEALTEALDKEYDYYNRKDLESLLVKACKGFSSELAAVVLTMELAKASGSSTQAALADGLVEVCKGLSPVRAGTYLLHVCVQYPALQKQLIPSLFEVAGRSSLQDSVMILKHPLCFGDVREEFLRRVEQLAGQKFTTRWQMADWLTLNHPEIDLVTRWYTTDSPAHAAGSR